MATLLQTTLKMGPEDSPILFVSWKNSTSATKPSLSAAVAVAVISMGPPRMAPLAGGLRAMGGLRLVTMVTATGAEVAVAPALSVAMTVKRRLPKAMLLKTRLNGALVSSPSRTLLSKNSTRATAPSASDAAALIVRLVPTLTTALLAGLRMTVRGGRLVLMVTL